MPTPSLAVHRPYTEHGPPAGLLRRLLGGAQRRVKRWHRSMLGHARNDAAARAVQWLAQWATATEAGWQSSPCHHLRHALKPSFTPGSAGVAVAALAEFGQLDAAATLAYIIARWQLPDGGFAATDGGPPSLIETSQAAAGLLAVLDHVPHAAAAAARACAYLASRIEHSGQLLPESPVAPEAWCEPARLACLPALAAAADRLDRPAWKVACRRAVAWHARRNGLWSGSVPMLWRAAAAAACLELAEPQCAQEILRWVPWPCRGDGTYPEAPHAGQANVATQALLAQVWFQLGEFESGSRLLGWLCRQQLACGALPCAVVPGWPRLFGPRISPLHDVAATARFARACQLQVRAHFSSHGHTLPQNISPQDGRLECVLSWARRLGPAPCIAEVGCGPGRYLARLRAALPAARLVGIDADEHLIARLPGGIERRKGSVLRLPAASGEFDGVLAIESLEHCLLPQHAVRELCRVTRPGGSVLIIDKHAVHQPLSLYQPWERWFWPQEVSAWLAQCGCVTAVRSIAHGPHTRPTGLFLAWEARLPAAASRAA
jgi:SAM-dependent methyltransferase